MMIHKYTTHVDYKWLLKRLDTQVNESTNQNSINVPLVVMLTSNKTVFFKFGD